MAKGPMPFAALCALFLAGAGCSSRGEPEQSPTEGSAAGGGAGDTAGPQGGRPGVSGAGSSERGGAAAGGAGAPSAGDSGVPPPAVDGRSVYAQECHGESKDCKAVGVPCFGVGSATPNVAAGWACANRCESDADCSDAPSGAEAEASCVSFTSTRHCVLVCENEGGSFSCPSGMSCYTAPRSPIGYCLWQ